MNIGTGAGYGDKAPNIGDNCYIGLGVKMYGNMYSKWYSYRVNAAVNKSFSEGNIAIPDVPAKK